MKFILDDETIDADAYVLASNGIYIWKDNDWQNQIHCANRLNFLEKSSEQLKKHPNFTKKFL